MAVSAFVFFLGAFLLAIARSPCWAQPFWPTRYDTSVSFPVSQAEFSSPSDVGSWWWPFDQQPWNVLYHLGGNGPWIQKKDGVISRNIAAPESCEVEQVHMMSRHGERYPTKGAGTKMIKLLDRIKASGVKLKGDLGFVNDWKFFSDDTDSNFEQLTSTGQYAGTLETFTTGVKLRTRYEHLLKSSSGSNVTRVFAAGSQRIIDTASYFSEGFFTRQAQNSTTLIVIPETDDLGADTLTPGVTCFDYVNDTQSGHDQGKRQLFEFTHTYLPAISDRFHRQNPEIHFTEEEIYSMQEMCGFELLVRGSSPWCDVFTHREWRNFEYARDILHYYRGGPGNPFGPTMGWLWLNATANLLHAGPSAGPLYFSFVHDGDIVPMLAAFNIFPDKHHLPLHRVAKHRTWRTSQVTPMGGRIILERLRCSAGDDSSNDFELKAKKRSSDANDEIYVRLNINDGIVPIPSCDSGPGYSCPLDDFLELVRRRGEEVGDFREKCGLGKDAPDRITFLHQ
ncbi:phosphoglycerate mutase-like protein [Xylona heveae TC161]|uniref:3-phytase n=1 Tax=Xylona heveae (strain CBS 132557 / TC161) TaxID=1328760 RepID=A0A165FDR8_XYLHT|nr:phosphoglycerate mutase-like protein [Xylona heveae TC161]KZF20862.1 phosphoglycerate mutase-like protein [Xylona heveae TC161]